MECRTAQRMIPRYIQGDLKGSELNDFLDHVMNCQECYDELEVYYTIDAGLKELDGADGQVDTLKATIDRAMKESRDTERRLIFHQHFFYASSTVVFWFLLAAVIVQLRLLLEYAVQAGPLVF